MRRWFLFALVGLTLLLVAAAAALVVRGRTASQATATLSPAALAGVPRVTVAELRGQLATSSPPLVWDVRPVSAFAEGHIPGSRVTALEAIADAAAALDRKLPIVTVCAWPEEHTSARAALILENLGFTNVAALKGGIDAWKAAGYPMATGE